MNTGRSEFLSQDHLDSSRPCPSSVAGMPLPYSAAGAAQGWQGYKSKPSTAAGSGGSLPTTEHCSVVHFNTQRERKTSFVMTNNFYTIRTKKYMMKGNKIKTYEE